MAQNITLLGASYTAVPAVQLPKTGGGTARFDDASVTTAAAADVASGKVFLAADGTITTGTASGGGGVDVEALSVTQNGTYTAPTGKAYSPVTVNVAGSGSSSWTKIAEKEVTVSSTATAAATVETWATGHSEIWTNDKFVYVCVRDTAGPRNGYSYGTDTFFLKTPSNTSSSMSTAARFNKYQDSTGVQHAVGSSTTTGYGVYVDTIYTDGRLRIRRRYNSSYGTIDGTYKVEVYLLDPAGGIPIFE